MASACRLRSCCSRDVGSVLRADVCGGRVFSAERFGESGSRLLYSDLRNGVLWVVRLRAGDCRRGAGCREGAQHAAVGVSHAARAGDDSAGKAAVAARAGGDVAIDLGARACFVAYLVGAESPEATSTFAVLGLFATAFQVACISLFCSAFCATAASAFVMSFLILAAIYVAPYFGVFIYVAMGLRTDHWNVTALGAAIDAPEIERAFKVIASSNGLSSHWVLNQWDGAGISVAPFHRDYVPLAVMTSIGFFFLLLARVVIVRRMAPQPPVPRAPVVSANRRWLSLDQQSAGRGDRVRRSRRRFARRSPGGLARKPTRKSGTDQLPDPHDHDRRSADRGPHDAVCDHDAGVVV